MKGWRSKFIFLLIVYFAGFATAIYCLAPAPENQSNNSIDKGLISSVLKSDEFAKSLNSGMHKCVDFAKDAALRAGELIKQKLDEKHQSND